MATTRVTMFNRKIIFDISKGGHGGAGNCWDWERDEKNKMGFRGLFDMVPYTLFIERRYASIIVQLSSISPML
jgi:hypothetical protein